MDERLQAWREMGYRWFRFRYGETSFIGSGSSIASHCPVSPVNRTTLIREPEMINSNAYVWENTHPDWVRKEGPYGRMG